MGCPLLDLHSVSIVGGCMMETARMVCPVVVCFNKESQTLINYVFKCEVAKLEAEYYDASFFSREADDAFGTADARAARMQGALDSCLTGFTKAPDGAFCKDGCYVARHGPIPMLAFRSCTNSAELTIVRERIELLMRVLPVSDLSLEDAMKGCDDVLAATIFHTSLMNQTGKVQKGTEDKSRVDALVMRPVIAPLAALLLRTANECEMDARGEFVNEFHLAIGVREGHDAVIAAAGRKETTQITLANGVSVPELSKNDFLVDRSYTLMALFRRTGRSFHPERLLSAPPKKRCLNPQAAVTAVVEAVFEEDQVALATQLAATIVRNSVHTRSALEAIGRIVSDEQCLVIAQRERDGRLSRVHARSHGKCVDSLSRDGTIRILALSPWAVVVIIDGEASVSVLKVKNDTLQCSEMDALRPQKLRVDAALVPKKDAVSMRRVQELEKSLKEVKDEVSRMRDSIANFESSALARMCATECRMDKLESAVNARPTSPGAYACGSFQRTLEQIQNRMGQIGDSHAKRMRLV